MSHDTAQEPPALEQLRADVATIIGTTPDQIADDANLLYLGLDSLGVMRLVNQWRRNGIRVSSRELVADPTVAGWHEVLLRLRAQADREEPGATSAR